MGGALMRLKRFLKPALLAALLVGFGGLLGSSALAATRYHRNDTQMVNSLSARILGTTNTNSNNFLEFKDRLCTYINSDPPDPPCSEGVSVTYSSDVSIRHWDGSETVLGTNVAPVTITLGDPDGYQSATWTPPASALAPKDAIKIVERITTPIGERTRAWITERLGGGSLASTPWTFIRFVSAGTSGIDIGGDVILVDIWARLWYGHATNYNTRIEDFPDLSVGSIDIGLRVFDGTAVLPIAAEPVGTLTSPLRIAKNDWIYGVVLVDIADPNATKIRINTSSGPKALLRFIPPASCGNSICNSGAGETCTNCPSDCGACPLPPPGCPDEFCNGTETCATCPQDCGACCSNQACDFGEDCSSCPADCGACPAADVCPDTFCTSSETCLSCPADCGVCGVNCSDLCPPPAGAACATSLPLCVGMGPTPDCTSVNDMFNCYCCGCPNGQCDFGEDCSSCPADCGAC